MKVIFMLLIAAFFVNINSSPILAQNKDYYFSKKTLSQFPEPFVSGAIALDLGMDGDLDIVYPIRGDLIILENNGNGDFVRNSSLRILDENIIIDWPRDLAIADFNGDGRVDLFIADHGDEPAGVPFEDWPGGQSHLFLQNEDGILVDETAARLPQQTSFTHATAVGDITGDGSPDIYLANYVNIGTHPEACFFINDGEGNFTSDNTRIPEKVYSSYPSSELADVDLDGDLDLILGGSAMYSRDALLFNDGKGNFTLSDEAAIPLRYAESEIPDGDWRKSEWSTWNIESLDINNDSYPDLAMGTLFDFTSTQHPNSNPDIQTRVQLLLNNKDGTFSDITDQMEQDIQPLAGYDNGNAWILFSYPVDLNADNYTDLVVRVWDGETLLFYNQEGKRFINKNDLIPSLIDSWTHVLPGDFTGDESIDVAVLTDRDENPYLAVNENPYFVVSINLVFPTNASTTDVINPTLVWNKDANADSYKIQLSKDEFATTLIDQSITDTTITTSGLAFNTTYQWRVKSINSVTESAYSDSFTFTTRVGDVTAVALSTPRNDSSQVPINPRLQWNKDANAATYQIQLSADSFSTTIVDQEVSDTTFSVSNLSYLTAYHWRVRAKNSYSTSEWSSTRTFTTKQAPVQEVTLQSPAHESSEDSINTTLVWKSDANADSYRIQVSTGSFVSTLVDSSLTDTTLNLANLAYNTAYQWRVKAINSVSESEWTEAWSFTTRVGDVSTVELSLPTNNEVLDFIAPTFAWNKEQNANTYQLEVSSDNFASTIINETLSDTTFSGVNLANGFTYQWRVKATNVYSESDWSTFTFEIPVTTSLTEELPHQTQLLQSYPNPFNPTTQINYSLAQTSNVVLEVYNMNGERIAELERGTKNAGVYSVTFNAANLPSGMYVYRLTANGNVITRKMLLIK